MKIVYRERVFIDNYKCIDYIRTIKLLKSWKNNNILYGYIDRFNIKAISIENIISIEGSI